MGQPTWLTLDGSMLTIAVNATDDADGVGNSPHNFTVVASDVSDSALTTTLEVALTIANVDEARWRPRTP